MFNIIPLILILISLSIIIFIIAKKFSVLANLDLDSIQSEREVKVKEQIIGNRLKRNYFKFYSKFIKIIRPLNNFIFDFFKGLYEKALDFKENYNKHNHEQEEESVESLFLKAEQLLKEEKLEDVENIYIKIIALDSKNIKAFRGLGKLYFEKKNYEEGKQTFLHAIKLLDKELDEISLGEKNNENKIKKEEINSFLSLLYYDLFLIAKVTEKNDDALEYINKALKIEPNNPRFLDTKLEISIMNKKKSEALDVFQRLKEVNPGNSKLDDLEKQINEI